MGSQRVGHDWAISLSLSYLIRIWIANELPSKTAPDSDEFTGEFYQTLKEEIMSIIFSLFQKTEAKAILPNLFYNIITLMLLFIP